MIDFKLPNGESVDIDAGANIQIAAENPLLNIGSVPGSRVYKLKALPTAKNRRNFNFPELLNVSNKLKKIEGVDLYIHKTRWKRGVLRMSNASHEAYDISFYTDAGDIAQKIEGKTMPGLDLGSEPLDLVNLGTYPDHNYVIFPVYNNAFYGDKNPDWKGYMNFYHGGEFTENTSINQYNIVPFPYLLYILKKTFQSLGYRNITGDFTTDPVIQKVVIYNNYALDLLDGGGVNVYGDTVTFNQHVPDMSIGQFLIEVAVYFGLQYDINEQDNTIEITRFKDILADQRYMNLEGRSGRMYTVTPNDYAGIRWLSRPDSSDKLMEENIGWLTHHVDGKEELIESNASPLSMGTFEVRDSFGTLLRTWTVPYVEQLGSSPEFDLGLNRSGLRFMFYEGIVNGYPQGNYQLPELSLRLGDANGIVNAYYTEYIAFKQLTEQVSRDIHLKVPDFFNLDFRKKVLTNQMKYLIGEYSAKVNRKTGLQPVGMKLWKTLI